MVFSPTELAFTWIEMILTTVGIPGLFALMTVESLGIPPLPSEVILPFAGVLLSSGTVGLLGIPFTWVTVMVAALAGGLLGALLGYLLGRLFGMPLIHRFGRRLHVDEEDLHKAEQFFARRGEPTVFFSRMLPIVRAYISYPAGAARMEPVRFSVFTAAGSFPFTLALVYAGVVLGENFGILQRYFTALDVVGGIAILAIIGYLLWRKRSRATAPPAGP